MSAHCEHAERFADGELAPEAAEAFRDHLLDCDRCKAELGNLLQLKMMAARHAEREPAFVPAPSRAFFSRWSVAAAVGAACAALLAVGVYVRSGRSKLDPWLAREPERRLEMRLALAAADQHRPLAARKMGQAGSPGSKLSLEALSELERNDDAAGLAAAFLARNDPSLVEQAEAALAPLPGTPRNETLRATALLMKGKPAEALRRLELALEQEPAFAPALWNKALALRDLDLLEPAALLFRQLAQQGEPGWSEEARQRAEALSTTEQARIQRWKAVLSAGLALSKRGTVPSSEILAERSPILRLHFYDAVRTRTTPEQVRALLPLARELDQQAGGGDVLARYVERVASHDFTRRAPWAEAYTKLREGALPPEQTQALITELLGSQEDDLLMGALVYAKAVARHLEAFEARAEASQDPWFRLLAAQERAAALAAKGQHEEARQTLLGANALCAATPIEYRCQLLRLDLSKLESKLLRLDEAWESGQQAWRQARASNNRDKEELALGNLAQLARLRNDGPLARASFAELLTRSPGKEFQRFAHQTLAHVALRELRFELAREEMDLALATGLPLTFNGAMALAELSRQRAAPGDEAALLRAISDAPATTPAIERLILKHALGRFTIERDRQKGRMLLEEVLQALESGQFPPEDETAQKIRAYTFTSLILDAGKAGDSGAALEWMGQERGAPLPTQCLVAVLEDSERSLLIVRGASGQLLGTYEGARKTRLPQNLSGFVSGEALAALKGCEKVEAFARPPLMDRPGLLPAELAWSYRLRAGAPPAPRPGRGLHLVVKDVALSPERVQALGQLNAWSAAFGPTEEQRVLTGTEATATRVLSAMRDATEVDLVTHGVTTPWGFSYLVLAREGSSDELTADHLQSQRLEGAPLVVLAACRAARTAHVLHEATGLPAALLRAGARAVFAATEEIPDLEAAEFFNAVRERIRQGRPPASALRDERQRWLAAGRGQPWLEGVLLYE